MTSNNGMTEAQQMAQTLGVVLGAASCCEEVTEERVNTVTAKLRQLVLPRLTTQRMPALPIGSFLLPSTPAGARSKPGKSILMTQRRR